MACAHLTFSKHFLRFLSKVESEMTDSESSEFHDFYEDTVRDSLTSILHKAFGILCREPAEGFSRLSRKEITLGTCCGIAIPKSVKSKSTFLHMWLH